MRPITHLVVHCSATKATMKVRAADIDRWHRERGFDRIGYHYFIGLDGKVEEGRPLEAIGAHVQGHNRTTVGICMAGGVGEDGTTPEATFGPEQYEALEALLRTLREQFPDSRICGHRDFPNVAKACPSFDVKRWCARVGIVA